MIPWIESHTYALGPIVLQTWGTFVAAGLVLGATIAARRAKKQGLDPNVVWDAGFWMLIAGFIGARLFHVAFYDPAYYLAHPLEILDFRQPGYAILGGFLGAAGAFWVIAKQRGLNLLAYADTMVWGLPWGCGVGRLGCFLIHDHPGTLTSFVGGVRYPDGAVRHDLGLYLSVFSFGIGILFVLLDRKRRQAGFYLGTFLIIYAVGRFLLDLLRLADRRLIGLTPSQWVLIGFLALGVWMLTRLRRA